MSDFYKVSTSFKCLMNMSPEFDEIRECFHLVPYDQSLIFFIQVL